jgi:hypothetical protein
MAQAQRQNALEQANQLRTQLNQMLPAENASYSIKRLRCNEIVFLIEDRAEVLWSLLMDVKFSDIVIPDDCVIALNSWNTLLRETIETLTLVKQRLVVVVKNKFEAFNAIQEFITELSKVISRCILQLGLLHSGNHP